ncbi:MAG: integrase, partial [Actinomycetota bacterium]
NYFQPQMHLIEKTRQGAKVSRRYDRAQTPAQRLMVSPHVPEEARASLEQTYRSLNPVALKRDILGSRPVCWSWPS